MSGVRSRLRLRILLPTAVLALAGVGVSAFAFGGTPPVEGSDPLPSPAAPAATTTEEVAPAVELSAWSEGANALCRATLEQIDTLGEPRTPDALQTWLTQSLTLEQALLTKLEALPRPQGKAKQVERLLAAARRSTRAVEQAIAIGIDPASRTAFGKALDRSHAQGERFDALARELGARACADDGSKGLSPLEKALLRDEIVVVVVHANDSTLDRLTVREARAGASDARVGFLTVAVGSAEDLETIRKAYDVRRAPAVVVMRRWVGAVYKFGGWVDRTTVAQAARNAKR